MPESLSNTYPELKWCVIIPTYNNEQTLESVIQGVQKYADNIIVVNDGATDSTSEILSRYSNQVTVVNQPQNMGKGMALRKGFQVAQEMGFEHAITIDSDGQHEPADIPAFLKKLAEQPGQLIMGARNMDQDSVPGTSSFGNKFSSFWYKVETGISLPDTQTGYRLYPISRYKGVKWFTRKFEFEIEVIVRSAWKGIPVSSVPVSVFYAPKDERITHFRPFKDFTRISILNTVLLTIAFLWIKPRDFFRFFKKKASKKSLLPSS